MSLVAYRVAPPSAREGGDGKLSESERAELIRLRKENAELAIERDVPKRSVAPWVNEARGAACWRTWVRQSMGRTGSALDNATAEAFDSMLEFELLRRAHFGAREQTRRTVGDWIDE